MDAHSLYSIIPSLLGSLRSVTLIDAIMDLVFLEIGIAALLAIWYICLCWMRRIQTQDWRIES